RSRSTLPRETDYNRSRWSLAFSFTKVFWKGEFEGKNLFFKKGFPLIAFNKKNNPLEKTSITGSQLAGDRKFFQADEVRRIIFSRKERKAIFKTLRTLRTSREFLPGAYAARLAYCHFAPCSLSH
ncbi:MAG: hypothetical protein IJH67_14940, partial [Thermoguttaceae bacterium]|nr:hypothetical protein [Thermoguttaceae bacterium]